LGYLDTADPDDIDYLYTHDRPTDWRVQIVSVVTNSSRNSTALDYVHKVYDYLKAGTNNDERITYQVLCLNHANEDEVFICISIIL
jgi:hypothetical protein